MHRSEVRSALDPKLWDLRKDQFFFDSGPHSDAQHIPSIRPAPGETAPGENATQFVRDAQSDGEKIHQSQSSDIFEKYMIPLLDENGEPRLNDAGLPSTVMAPHPNDLQGRTFLTNPEKGRQVKRVCIVEAIDKYEAEHLKDPALVKFKVRFDRSEVEDIMTYN